MIPALCRVKHDPENGKYADCVRACIASVLELNTEDVPHFHHDDPDGWTAISRIKEFLFIHKLAPFYVTYDAILGIEEILSTMGEQNSDSIYLLFGKTTMGGHVVVCKGGEIVHDPAWYRMPIVSAGDGGYWSIMVLGRC